MEEWGVKRDGERVKGRKDEMRMLAYGKCSGSGSAWNRPFIPDQVAMNPAKLTLFCTLILTTNFFT
jgi:hypothetical protein